MCPNCPAVKEHMATLKLKGSEIDASTEQGLKEAVKYGVMSVPTIIFFGKDGKEITRANSVSEIKKITENKGIADFS